MTPELMFYLHPLTLPSPLRSWSLYTLDSRGIKGATLELDNEAPWDNTYVFEEASHVS